MSETLVTAWPVAVSSSKDSGAGPGANYHVPSLLLIAQRWRASRSEASFFFFTSVILTHPTFKRPLPDYRPRVSATVGGATASTTDK